jgi:hypothetical protein
MPLALSDSELDADLAAARPLPVECRDAFLQSVASALQGCREIGPGVVHQVCREQQRIFMNGAWPDLSRSAGSSKYR